jgi:hypothetical protein
MNTKIVFLSALSIMIVSSLGMSSSFADQGNTNYSHTSATGSTEKINVDPMNARTDYSDEHCTASHPCKPVCADHVCKPGETPSHS